MVTTLLTFAAVIIGGLILLVAAVKLLWLLWSIICDLGGLVFAFVVVVIISFIVMAIL